MKETPAVDKPLFSEPPSSANVADLGQDETLPEEEHFLVQPTFAEITAPAAVKKSKKRKVDAEKEEYESVDKTASEIPQFADLGNSGQDETLPGEEQFLVQPTCCDSTAPAAVRRGKKRKGEYEAAKPRRAWELWSKDDKLFFFEAINEYGKDFDKILAFFQKKFKNKETLPEYIKNKNQIRHFYYRSWHKISPYIKFGPDIKKSTKELFGLINYGELCKKVGDNLDKKRGPMLDELVQTGSVVIRQKGKRYTIKTPVCRALKNIHNKGAGKKSENTIPLPKKVVLELRPQETRDWVRVQSMAQNPHVKVTLGLERTLASLISCLIAKWKTREEKTLESMKQSGEKVAGQEEEEELVLFPLQSAKISIPQITVAPILRSSHLSLQSLKTESKPKVKLDFTDEGTLVTESNGNRTETANGNCNDTDNGATSTETRECDNKCPPVFDEGDPEYLLEDSEGESSRSPVPPQDLGQDKEFDLGQDRDSELVQDSVSDLVQDNMSDLIQDKDSDLGQDKDSDLGQDKDSDLIQDKESDMDLDQDDEDEDPVNVPKTNFSNLQNFERSKGWSLGSVGSLSVGELYCMLGEVDNPQIQLEYHWRKIKTELKTETNLTEVISSPCKPDECQNVLSKLVRLSSSMPGRPGRGRQTSISSPSVRNNLSPVASSTQGKPGRGRKNSLSSPTARNGNISPASSPLTSRSPTIKIAAKSRGAVKQLPLVSERPEKPGSPLAVPLEQEAEFRKPLAPAIKPAVVPSNFQKQLGQYFPRFSNRRGRQNKSRAKNLVGRQVLQPIVPQPRTTFQLIPTLAPIGTISTMPQQAGNQIILEATPLTIINTVDIQGSANHGLINAPVSPIHEPSSPPQICIPSPAPSPARRTPSPTPSLSAFMDISFPESAPATPTKSDNFMAMMDEGSLLQTPPRALSPAAAPTSPSRCLTDSADVSLTSWSLNFDSPIKQSSSSSLSVIHQNDDSQASTISTNSEVDRQLTAMMNENSLDFTASFSSFGYYTNYQ